MAIFAYIYESRVGQMNEALMSMYKAQPTSHLLKLRSSKYVRMQKLLSAKSWFDRREYKDLIEQLNHIDCELRNRTQKVILL